MFSRHNERSTKDPYLAFKSVLVPVNGSEASNMAVEFACTLAKRNKGKVHVVHVIEVRRSLPLDADLVAEAQRGEDILSQAEVVAKEDPDTEPVVPPEQHRRLNRLLAVVRPDVTLQERQLGFVVVRETEAPMRVDGERAAPGQCGRHAMEDRR